LLVRQHPPFCPHPRPDRGKLADV